MCGALPKVMLFVVSLGEMRPNIYGESRRDVAGLFALGGALGSGHVAVLDTQPCMHLSIAACKRYRARAHEWRASRLKSSSGTMCAVPPR